MLQIQIKCQKLCWHFFGDVRQLCDTTSLKFANLTNFPTVSILKKKKKLSSGCGEQATHWGIQNKENANLF